MSVLDDDLSPEAKAAYDSLLQAYVDWTGPVRTMDSLLLEEARASVALDGETQCVGVPA